MPQSSVPSQKKRGEQVMRCKACSREAGEREFCPAHLKAYENVVEKYEVWRKALNISWEEYLREIEKHSLTGEWAKEVAEHLISNGEVKDGEEI
jgi:predicted metal-binding protein